MLVLDHAFIMCDVNAPGATALPRLGLEEMPSNTHPGQGTACRRFSLAEQYLELLWVSNEDEARSDPVRPTQLWERWVRRQAGACPFGLVFRADSPGIPNAPFRSWPYTPAYLPSGLSIEVGRDAPMDGPGFFFLPFVSSSRGRPPVRIGSNTVRKITSVRIGVPGPFPESDAIQWAQGIGLLSFERSAGFQLTLSLDHGANGQSIDLGPDLPLILHW